jgi:DNA primase
VAIAPEDVQRVREATDIVALVSQHTRLAKKGRRWVGLCPFHSENTPSFSVNAEEGVFYCFGCHASGDAITFLRNTEHLDFTEAVEQLAERAGIVLQRVSAKDAQRESGRKKLYEVIEAAVSWYVDRLADADAKPAREYLAERGYGDEVIRRYRIGWAPDGWDPLAHYLMAEAGFSPEVVSSAGLAFANSSGRLQDQMRSRIIFPIFDPSGRAIAIAGRILPGRAGDSRATGEAHKEAKYKNSPETSIYAKRRTLYGLNWAKSEIAQQGEIVVCEGYTDVIAFHVAGIDRAVATCGTALTEEHVKLMARYAKRIMLCYDGDSAGQHAIEQYYEWEERYGFEVRVVALPPGKDPADVARRDPAELRRSLAHAKRLLQFRIESMIEQARSSGSLNSVEGRVRLAEEAAKVLLRHPSPTVRTQYLAMVAEACALDDKAAEAVLGQMEAQARRPGAKALLQGGSARGPGLEALCLAVHRPEEVVGVLREELFVDPVERAAFQALAAANSLAEALESASPEASELLGRVSVEETDSVAEDVLRLLVIQASEQRLREVQGLLSSGSLRSEYSRDLLNVELWARRQVMALRELSMEGSSLESRGLQGREADSFWALLAWLTEGGVRRGREQASA